jgi:hypothetical protein
VKQATIQQPLLSNDSANKHVSTAMREYISNGRDVFCAACTESYNQDQLAVAVKRTAGVQLL